MSYKIESMAHSPNILLVHGVIDHNRFALREKKYTPEEKAAWNAKKLTQTPEEKLTDLMIETWQSKWKATSLYRWCEENAPGHEAVNGGAQAALIIFKHRSHALLCKLTWA